MSLMLMALLFVVASSTGAAPAIRTSLTLAAPDEPGVKLYVTGTVIDSRKHPIAGAEIHVYQTDASGRYTPDRPMDEPHARLSGWLRTDAQGRFELHTIRPGGYPKPVRIEGRERKIPAHIHLDVTAAGYASRKLQAVFADDPLLRDSYWVDWVRRLRQPVLEVMRGEGAGRADLEIELDLVVSR